MIKILSKNNSKYAFINGKIYTVNKQYPWASAILVEDNKIIYVGETKEALELSDTMTHIIDLDNKLVLPGFIDAHTHIFLGEILNLGIRFDPSNTKQELLMAIQQYSTNNPNTEFIFGSGFAADIFDKDEATAEELDAIILTKPAIFIDEGCHSMWVNSKALEIANITKETKDPIPYSDYYKRDKDGNPTGWIVESQSMQPIIKKLGLLEKILKKDLSSMFHLFSSYGITSVFNASEFFFNDNSVSTINYMENLALEGKSTLRFFTSYSYNNHENPKDDPVDILNTLNIRFQSDYTRMNTLKIWLDGTVEARNAALSEPYENSDQRGSIFYSTKELQQVINKASANGLNIHLHAIGDKTINTALEICKNSKKKFPLSSSTYTIAHNEVFNKDTLHYFTDSGVIANTTPLWHVASEDSRHTLGNERYQNLYPFNSLIKKGVLTTFGSDYPTGLGTLAMNVFYNIQAGHTRKFPKKQESLPKESEKLSLEDLIKGYTLNAAHQVSMQDKIGSIEKGKYADFIVLEKNIFEQEIDEIHNNHVILTVFDGKILYKR
ncbi:MAG: amidohydrolase [Spirochaetota bacterium]|nr:amidohydrolase [Spirochaetota bacterium]